MTDNVFFPDEIYADTKIRKKGLIGTANHGANMNTSEFFVTLTDEHLKSLDDKHTIFGIVAEGQDTLDKLNKVHVDEDNRPLANVRIYHTHIIFDPFENLEKEKYCNFEWPQESPERIEKGADKPDYDENLQPKISDVRNAKELDEMKKQKKSRIIAHNLT